MCSWNNLSQILVFVYGTLCPAYYTYKSLACQRSEETSAWSKYWIVFAFLLCIEVVADLLLSWLPMYSFTKLLLVLWVVFSAPQASVWLYDSIVNPFLTKRQSQIDYFLQHDKHVILNSSLKYFMELLNRSQNVVKPLMWRLWLKCTGFFSKGSKTNVIKQPAHFNENVAGAVANVAQASAGELMRSLDELSESTSEEVYNGKAEKAQDTLKLKIQNLRDKPKASLTDLGIKSVNSSTLATRRRNRHTAPRGHRRSSIETKTMDLSGDEPNEVADLLAESNNERPGIQLPITGVARQHRATYDARA